MRILPSATLLLLAATPALAHTGAGAVHGFEHGFLHPLLGLDHLLAIVAVGVWSGLVGGRALWAWPAAFVAVMLAGAFLGLGDLSVPGVEIGIAASVAVLGLAVAMQLPLPVAAGVALCGVFALLHGQAHGAELPAGASPLGYILGFTLATAMLHGLGLGLGRTIGRLDRVWLPGVTGGAVAATGLVLLLG